VDPPEEEAKTSPELNEFIETTTEDQEAAPAPVEEEAVSSQTQE
tara:strand:- start:256 stop:387 length:132 start_codon:yes stop_codon:yes gene_type:complete